MKLLSVLILVGALSAAFSSLASSAAGNEAPMVTSQIVIRPGAGGCVVQGIEGPEVTEVRGVVLPRLVGVADAERTAVVRAALMERYGARVSETSAPGYVWRWNPITEQWELLCLSASELEVDFGARGTVVVESHDAELMRPVAN